MSRGGRISVDSQAIGGKRRTGEILEVLGAPDRVRYRVRWEDGQETIFYPGSDTHVSLARAGRRRAPEATASRVPKRQPPTRRPAPAGLRAEPGDQLVIRAHRLGEPRRDAEILEVLGDEGAPPFRVRWQDTGTESLFFPGSDALVEHLHAPGRARDSRRHRSRRGR